PADPSLHLVELRSLLARITFPASAGTDSSPYFEVPPRKRSRFSAPVKKSFASSDHVEVSVMISQAWKLKLPLGSFLLAMLTLLTQAPAARAQFSSLDVPSDLPFGSRAGQILGTVYRNRSSEPASQVFVHIRSLSSGMIQTVLTDFSGHFELPELPQGAYEVSAEESGYGF